MENNKVNLAVLQREIKGWGVDADPDNEPTYPMKHYTGDDHQRSDWERPEQQVQTVEILKSNERPNLPAVYGTVAPPTGLSGAIRRYAFQYSENQYRHWLPLLLADRVNVIEGIIDDLSHGHIPNFIAESGWGAMWKHNPSKVVKKVAVQLVVLGAITALIFYKKNRNKNNED